MGARGPAGDDRSSKPSGEDGRNRPSDEDGRSSPLNVGVGTDKGQGIAKCAMGPDWGEGGSLGEDAPTEAPTELMGTVDGAGSKPCPDAGGWPSIKQKLKVNK